MSDTIYLFVTGFGRPDLLAHQHRLLNKYLTDPFSLIVVDNTDGPKSEQMQSECREWGMPYHRLATTTHLHPEALNYAAGLSWFDESIRYWGVIDHDLFPRAETGLIDKIDSAGFYGIGQRHTPTQSRYLFPGFAFFDKEWLNGRVPDFNGIRGIDRRDDGDCGSMMHPLFSEEDWAKMYRGEHGYGFLRDEDGFGLQSFGYEYFDRDWIHFTNASHWKEVPDSEGRDRAILEMLETL